MSRKGPDIAIVGMSCVFPGAEDLSAYWNNILAKVDAVSDPPPDWGTDLFYDPDTTDNDRTYCKRGGWIGDLAAFDPVELGVIPKAVDGGEPDHFLALKAAHEALQDAGYDAELLKRHSQRSEVIIGRGTYVNRGNATAIQQVVGVETVLRTLRKLHPEYSDEQMAEIRRELKASLPAFNSDTSAALVPNIISGRIANRLDLMGANYIVDAACASSLVAVDHAVRDLQTGRCDLAVAGGVHASTPPVILVIFSHLKALSRSGAIRPFDARADGTLLGEGVGMVVLKRLEDAERDCDRIYGIVKGVGVASDGRALGLLAPRLEGEMLALERAYEAAGVPPETVGLIEAHGTGTLVGDATELEALESAFGKRLGALPDVAIGSVKSMISHTMPASGIAGLIKAVLALHHKVLPPTICEEPHERLRDPSTRFYVNTEARPWIHADAWTPRRAGVNAFGFGGINAHAVVEEYTGRQTAPWLQTSAPSELFILSGDTPAAAAEDCRALLHHLESEPQSLPYLAWRTNCTREWKKERVAIVATSREDLISKLQQAAEKLDKPGVKRIKMRGGVYYSARKLAIEGSVGMMFPGEGAQYPNMLRDLCLHFPEVREVFELMDRAFQNHPRSRLPSQVVFPPTGQPTDGELIWSMDAGAEAVFAANQAVLRLLQELRIQPDAVLGHSTGEHSALLAAGVVRPSNDEEFIEHVLGVNRVFEQLKNRIPPATLVAVAGGKREKLERIVAESDGKLFIALDNCANQVVFCGSDEGVDQLIEKLKGGSEICQRLPMARAYHTPWFQVFSEPLRAYFEKVAVEAPATKIYSCVTADAFPQDKAAIRDLIAVSWSSTVRFRDSVEKMYEDGVRVFIESGPRGNLSGFVGDILRGREHLALPIDIRTRQGLPQLHHVLAQLIAHGADPHIESLYRRRSADIEPKPKSKRLLKLSSGLQPMQLDDERKPFERPVAAKQATSPEQPAEKPAAKAQPKPQPPEEALPAAAAAASHSKPHSGPATDPRARAMQSHLANMERFLETQQQVVGAYLERRGRGGAALASAHVSPATRTPPFVAPFIDRLARQQGDNAVAERRLTLSRDRLFADHTLGREVSNDDPTLSGLPVVPLTVTLEILAEAAAAVAPSLVCTGMRNVTASRWIVFDEPEIDLELETQTLSGNEVRVRLRTGTAPGTLRPVVAEAVVQFAESRPHAAPSQTAITREQPSSWKPEDLYRKGMFHGPRFRGVQRMLSSGSDGCRAVIETLPRNELIEGQPDPHFIFDPVILDAAGQVVAFWSQEALQPYADIFPYRLEKLECFQSPPAPGDHVECRVYATKIEDRTIVSDIDIVDAAGRLVYRLKAWEDRRFSPPRSFWDLRISPKTTFLSATADDLLGEGGDSDRACVDLTAYPADFFDGSHGVWTRTLANIVLTRAEREAFTQVTNEERREWLSKRIALKDAARRLAERKIGAAPAYADVEIVARADHYLASGKWTERLGAPLTLTLASAGDRLLAVASAAQGVVGLQVQPLSAGEDLAQQQLACAKAAAATVGSLDVVASDSRSGAVRFFAPVGSKSYRGRTKQDNGFVLAALIEETTTE